MPLRLRTLALGATLLTGCIEYLGPGELGQLRYFGEVDGEVPLRMIPPVSDRDGNAYVLFGSADLPEVIAYVGHEGGGWSGGCDLHQNTTLGVHGFVGRAQDRAWYWSGEALVEVDGTTGGCQNILDVDPNSATDLQFLGVIPYVKETPSRTTLIAMISSLSDPVPFTAVVDLDNGVYTNLERFRPPDGINVTVLGVGAHPETETGAVLLRYEKDGEIRVEGHFVNIAGGTTDRAPITGGAMLPAYSVMGYLQMTANLAVGVISTGEVVAFDRGGGGFSADTKGIAAVGVHSWNDELFVVGSGNGRPLLGPINSGGLVTGSIIWSASERAAGSLSGSIQVLDDRTQPFRERSWQNPTTAVGPFPFVHPHSPHRYAQDTTATVIAGPSFQTGGNPRTSVAYAPIGISYP